MIIKQIILGSIENNNYLLIDDNKEGENKAVLIDCTQYSEDIVKTLEEYGAILKYILLTHGHFDHILGVNDFKKKYSDCKILVNKKDQILLSDIGKFAQYFGLQNAEAQNVDGFVEENQIIKFGQTEIKVIETSGHTLGGVCYLVNDNLFTGDTLFLESVGRTDLPGGNFNELKSNIQEKLFTLDDKIKVYPGHGPSSTIGHEKINNQFL